MVGKSNIAIWQQNINKSPACQHNLVSNDALATKGIDIIAIQEPAINSFNQSIASRDWYPIYPTTHKESPSKTRSMLLIRSNINTDSWDQLDFPSRDVTAIQLKGEWGKLTLLNIYNDGNNDDTLRELSSFQFSSHPEEHQAGRSRTHTIWLGDFNRHHPFWDDPNDTRLFTAEAIRAAERLIETIADHGLITALPNGTPTHQHNVTKRWSRLDQVFISEHSMDLVLACKTQPDYRGINTDHLPILTEINLQASLTEDTASPNFRDVDWGEFGSDLERRLNALQPPTKITTQRFLDRCCEELTKAIQETINAQVPKTKIMPKSKRW